MRFTVSKLRIAKQLFLLLCLIPCSSQADYVYPDRPPGYPIGYYDQFAYRPIYISYPTVIPLDGLYWSRWTDTGYGCRSSCLIDINTGVPVRCKRSCKAKYVWVVR